MSSGGRYSLRSRSRSPMDEGNNNSPKKRKSSASSKVSSPVCGDHLKCWFDGWLPRKIGTIPILRAVSWRPNHMSRIVRLVEKVCTDSNHTDQDGTGNLTKASGKNAPDSTADNYGLTEEFLKSLGIYGQLNNKIFVFNLDIVVTKEKLKEIFAIAGVLAKTELDVDEDGSSKGQATLEYEHPLEAVQAISLFNGQQLYSRIINVCMEKIVDNKDNSMKLPSGLHGIGKGLGVNGQLLQNIKKEKPTNDSNKMLEFGKSIQDSHELAKGKSDVASGKGDACAKGSDDGQRVRLDCVVCLQSCNQPVKLPCHHIFCYLCVKGITNMKCPMCRQDFPAYYLENPIVLALEQSTVTFDGSYQWFYEGRNGWWQYDDRTSSEIEAAFKDKKQQCEVVIAGILYTIDFQMGFQMRKCDPGRRRRIKRDLVTIPKKGVAGIRVNQPIMPPTTVNQAAPPTANQNDQDPDVVILPIVQPVRPNPEVIEISEESSDDSTCADDVSTCAEK